MLESRLLRETKLFFLKIFQEWLEDLKSLSVQKDYNSTSSTVWLLFEFIFFHQEEYFLEAAY